MRRYLLLAAALAAPVFAQSGPRNLNFEEGRPGEVPDGWFAPKAIVGYSVKLTGENPKAGKSCAEIDFVGPERPSAFGNIMQSFDGTPYRGKRVRFRAAVKISPTADADRAQMWFRVDLPDKSMGFFDNMDNRPIRSQDWQYYDITGDIDSDAGHINIGLMLIGKGKAWIDDASIEILGDVPSIKSYVVPPAASFDKLTEAARLWVYVKYFHTRVTMPEIDWDNAFIDAVPNILESKDDDAFTASLNAMLAPLHDPFTRAVNPAREKPDDRIVPAIRPGPKDVVVVGLDSGNPEQAEQARPAVIRDLNSAKAAVFDVRGSRSSARNLAGLFPVASDAIFPWELKRIHYGYAPQYSSGYQGYHSLWQIDDGARIAKSAATPLRPVFLVNSHSIVPDIALALQDSGGCAIISEDEISDAQARMGSRMKVGNLDVWVRTHEYDHADGTSGLTANVVLHKTGDAALQEAIEIARSGKWPAPIARSRVPRPPAVFTEKTDSKRYPATQLRLLAAARIWGVFNYFHPYKYLYGEDWNAVLAEFLPKMAAAADAREYNLAVAEMVAHTHDTHCYVDSGALAAARGVARPGVEVRWIENQPVVTRVTDPELTSSVHPGDVIIKVNGEPVQKRIDELSPAIAASTPQSLLARVMGMLLNGTFGSKTAMTVRGADGVGRDVQVSLAGNYGRTLYPSRTGEVYRLLNPRIGYVDLERLTNAQVDAMFEAFKNTEAIIMDMRGYPQGTAWSIAPRLATSPGKVRAQVRTNVVSADGEDNVCSEVGEVRIPLTDKPRYQGKTILLIDDRAISQSEASGLMFKAANGTVFIGSPTTGANGDITGFMAPGGIRIPFSGHDSRWPDGKQLQRVGLVPDIEAHPTIQGIRAGRDEILDRAVAYIETGH